MAYGVRGAEHYLEGGVPAGGLSVREAVELTSIFRRLAREMVILDPAGLEETIWIAVSKGLTAYDASYIALALRRGMTLVTEDKKLAQASREYRLKQLASTISGRWRPRAKAMDTPANSTSPDTSETASSSHSAGKLSASHDASTSMDRSEDVPVGLSMLLASVKYVPCPIVFSSS